uniref:Uncharacterized protein n=1 Tax=Oryza sativa subsp. japonica TaxID=39947 RepID=Q5VRI6_ORYSJ|nr:hypothetical protein [Oryza sativa Japonica Group]
MATTVDGDGGDGEWQGGDGKAAEAARIHAAPPESMSPLVGTEATEVGRRWIQMTATATSGTTGDGAHDDDSGWRPRQRWWRSGVGSRCSSSCSPPPAPQQPRHGPLLAGGSGPVPAVEELRRTILEMQAAHRSCGLPFL